VTSASDATRTVNAAGRIRRIRRDQNRASRTLPDRSESSTSCWVIRKPEITKKTSTPTNPPGSALGHRW
jgi:hypothetical protein